MEQAHAALAENLRALREERRWSLDKLSDLTGVSKSMLGQIERGESSPTIATVWKIANGLKVSFTSLLLPPQRNTEVRRAADLRPVSEDDGLFHTYPLFPYDEGQPFELYSITVDVGGELHAEAHGQQTEEFLTVFEGDVTVFVGEEQYALHTGDAIRFQCDGPHGYRNDGDGPARVSLLIHYRQPG